MYREQVFFISPFNDATWRSKSYTGMRMPDGINYAQFLKLPKLESSARSVRIPVEMNDEHIIHLTSPPNTGEELTFIDETSRVEALGKGLLPEAEEPRDQGNRRSVHVFGHDGDPMALENDEEEVGNKFQLINVNDPSRTVEGKHIENKTEDPRIDVEIGRSSGVNEVINDVTEKEPVLARKRKLAERVATRSAKAKTTSQGTPLILVNPKSLWIGR